MNEWVNWRRRSKNVFSIGLLGIFPPGGQERGNQWLSWIWGCEKANHRTVFSVRPGPTSCPHIDGHKALSWSRGGDSSLWGDFMRTELEQWVNSWLKWESNWSGRLFIVCLPVFPIVLEMELPIFAEFNPKAKQERQYYLNTEWAGLEMNPPNAVRDPGLDPGTEKGH